MASRSFFTGKQAAQFQAERVVGLSRTPAPVQHISDPRERRSVEDLVTPAVIARQLAVSVRAVYRLVSDHDMPARRVGGVIRFNQREVNEWSLRQGQDQAQRFAVVRGGRK